MYIQCQILVSLMFDLPSIVSQVKYDLNFCIINFEHPTVTEEFLGNNKALYLVITFLKLEVSTTTFCFYLTHNGIFTKQVFKHRSKVHIVLTLANYN